MTSANCEVAKFLDSNKYYVAKGHGGGFTHILSDGYKGGRVNVNLRDEHIFLAKYAADVMSEMQLYVNEQRSEVFRMFFDLDLVLHEDEGAEVWRGVLAAINDAMRMFYPTFSDADAAHYLTCIILDTPVKPHDRHVKRGFHLIYPFLHVDQQQALYLCEHVVRRLTLLDETRAFETVATKLKTRENGINRFLEILAHRSAASPAPDMPLMPQDRPLMEALPHAAQPWAKIIDSNVYRATGLRMPHSSKCANCSSCHNQPAQRISCTKCCKLGKIYSNATYTVQTAVHGDQALTDATELAGLMKNPFTRVILTSIRWASVIEARKHLPPEPEQQGTLQEPVPNGRFQIPHGTPAPRGFSCGSDGFGRIRRKYPKEVPRGSDVHSVLRHVIRTRLHEAYRDLEILDIYAEDKTEKPEYVIRVQGRGMSFCQNVSREHRTASIYFKVTHLGVVQRCFCRCNDAEYRRSGRKCMDYTSQVVPLLNNEMAIVYPGLERTGHTTNGTIFSTKTQEEPVQNNPGLLFRKRDKYVDCLDSQIRTLTALIAPETRPEGHLAEDVYRVFKRQKSQ